MLQRSPDFLSGERLIVRRPARSMGTNGFQMEISGNAGRRPANHAITERRAVYRASGRGLQGFCASASFTCLTGIPSGPLGGFHSDKGSVPAGKQGAERIDASRTRSAAQSVRSSVSRFVTKSKARSFVTSTAPAPSACIAIRRSSGAGLDVVEVVKHHGMGEWAELESTPPDS